MHLDGFFALGDGSLIVTLAHFSRFLVGADIHGKQLGIVFHMSFELCFTSLLVSHLPVVERIEACCGGMIESCGRGVLLGRAGGEHSHSGYEHAQAYASHAFAHPAYVCSLSHSVSSLWLCPTYETFLFIYNVRAYPIIMLSDGIVHSACAPPR